MRRSIAVQQQLHDAISDDIAKPTTIHRSRIARLKTVPARLVSSGSVPAAPLLMLAHGDSCHGLSQDDTDVIAQLRVMGNINPLILNVSHHGDASTDELLWPKQQRMIDALQDPANWLDNRNPDAILFSGGGDGLAGNAFNLLNECMPSSGQG